MHKAGLATSNGQVLAVSIARHGNALLLQSSEPEAFIEHVTGQPFNLHLPLSSYVQGIVVPGEGAIFELCDQLGTVVKEVARLDDQSAKRCVLDTLIAEVPAR
jgi:hypothetical protein